MHSKYPLTKRTKLLRDVSTVLLTAQLVVASYAYADDEFTPRLGITTLSDSNLFNAPEDQTDTSVLIVAPGFNYGLNGRKATVALDYELIAGRHGQSEDDDYNDHVLDLLTGLQLNRRNHLAFNAGYTVGHDEREFSDGDFSRSQEPDLYHTTSTGIKYTLGRKKSKGRIELGLEFKSKDYKKDEVAKENRSKDTLLFSPEFFWRATPRSNGFVGIEYEIFDYKNDPKQAANTLDTQDSERIQAYGGYLWDITRKTSGELRLGYTSRNFDDVDRADFSGLSWQGSAYWTYSAGTSFELGSVREDAESEGFDASYIKRIAATAQWKQLWSETLNSQVKISYSSDDYVDGPISREDKTTLLGLEVGYEFNRFSTLALGLTGIDSHSSVDEYSYKRQQAFMSINLTP